MSGTLKYNIEYHPKKVQIEKDIIAGVSDRQIAEKYNTPTVGVSKEAVRRYRKDKMPMILRHAELDEADGVINRINEYLDTVEQFYNSIRRVLDDPERPGEVCYYPRAEEVKVKWYNKDTEKYEVDTLQHLIDGLDITYIKGVYVTGKDPREYLLRTAETLNKMLETMSRVRGYITESGNTTVNIASGSVEDLANIARTALAPFPGALEAFAKAIDADADRQEAEAQKAMSEAEEK